MSPANSPRPSSRAIVSLGSNIEPRAEYLEKAIAALSSLPETAFVKRTTSDGSEPSGTAPGQFDLIDFGGQVINTPERKLTLHHPRAHLRDFVQTPLHEVGGL